MASDARGSSTASDSRLPQRLFDAVAHASGIRRLMAAVLLDAVAHLRRRGSRSAVEAERWIRSPHAEWAPFSFATICDALGLDPDYLARGLLGRPWHDAAHRPPTRRTVGSHGPLRITLARRRRRSKSQVTTA